MQLSPRKLTGIIAIPSGWLLLKKGLHLDLQLSNFIFSIPFPKGPPAPAPFWFCPCALALSGAGVDVTAALGCSTDFLFFVHKQEN